MERKWQTAVVWMLVSVVLGLLSILAVPWVTITGLVSTDVMAPTVIKAFRGLDDHKLWSFIIAWGCYPILAIAMWVIAQVWNSDDLDSSRRGSIRVGAWLVAAWTALAAIRTWGSLHPLSVLSTEGNYVTFQMRAQAGVWLALGSAACLVVAAMVRTSSNGLMAVPAPALRPILPSRHLTAATENLRSSPSYMSATPAAPRSLAVVSGRTFRDAMSRLDNQIPPAHTFPARFLNAPTQDWSESFVDVLPAPDELAVRTSIEQLAIALKETATGGAPSPVILCLEQAVTATLAWYVWLFAERAVKDHGLPALHDEALGLWGSSNPIVDGYADLLRRAADRAAAACATNQFFENRPDRVFEFVVSFLADLAKPLLATGSLAELNVANRDVEVRHILAFRAALTFSQSKSLAALDAAPIRPPLPLLSPRPPYVPTANPHRTGWVVLSVLVFAAIIAGMIARTRSSDPQAESVRTSPSTTVQIPTSVEVLIARVAAPLPPPTTVAPATTVSDGQRTDVALYVAQSLATAFATADWPTARTVSPQNPVWTDDKYALGFEGLQASYLSVAGSRLSGNTVDLWMTEVASELRAGRKRTAIYCVHWMYSEDSRTIQGIAGKTVRTVNGFQDVSTLTPADVDACKQFDGP